MLTAVLYGLLACAGFFVGVLVGLVTRPPQRLVAAIMAFGGGVLVSALTFDLMEEASAEGSTTYVIVGFLAGALIYVLADLALERMARASPQPWSSSPGDAWRRVGECRAAPGAIRHCEADDGTDASQRGTAPASLITYRSRL
jgi:ZIP family zinc transporter